MVITNVTTYLVRPRWGFVKIETDGGLTGWGEAVIEGKAATVLACVEEMKDYLLGADPMRIEDLWNVLYRAGFYRGGPILMSAMAGIDQALWDIKGKHFNAPVYQLMGGPCRDRMRVYSWIGGDRPSDVAKAAKEKQEAGFTAIKMNGTEELQMVDSYEKMVRTSRLIYNDSVTKLNREIRMFPVSLIAGMLGFRQRDYLEAREDKADMPSMK